ncbi:bacteriocin [Enterobacter cloacae]|uniref:bacteriocin n=1 Tax=Enterobacter cloacae TaxID=550 RepID=UPI002FFC617E
MKQLTTEELSRVSGGLSAFEQADKLFKGMLSWLTSESNPLNGRVVGQTIGNTVGSFFFSLAQSFASAFKAK